MAFRSYVKIGRRAENEGRYTSTVNPADGSGSGTGADGRPGKDGKDGEGVPTGGDTGQVLAKIDGTDFNTEWVDPAEGSVGTNFVSKTGDDLSGVLRWNNESGEPNNNKYIGIKIVENVDRGRLNILAAETGGTYEDGKLETGLVPKKDESITNKKYVDAQDVLLEDRITLLEKALLPYVEFLDQGRSLSYRAGSNYADACVRMYQYWETSPAGEWMWAWMIKFPGTDTWTDVDDLSTGEQVSIGYKGEEDGVFVVLSPPDEDDMPDIEVSLKVTDTVDGLGTVEGWSDPFFPRQCWITQGKGFSTQKQLPIKKGKKLWLTTDSQ